MQCKDEYAELDRRRHACSIIEVASALRRRDGQECSRKRGLSIVGMQVAVITEQIWWDLEIGIAIECIR